MADDRIRIGIEATNNASGPIGQVQNSLRGLEGAAGAATQGLTGIGTAIGVGAIAALAGQVGAAVVELARLGGAVQAVGTSFEGLASRAGAVPAQLLASLKAASNGTINEYNLMLAANKALLLGVADTSEEMGALMQIAQSRGRAMGLSVTQAFNDLVTGLGRVSPLILDNLGITVDLERVNNEYAASIGKTAAALTEQERKQALVNSVMAEAANIDTSNVEGMASSFERAQASIDNMKAALGELFGPAVAKVAETIANAVTGAVELVKIDGTEAMLADVDAIRQSLADLNVMKERTEALWARGVELDTSATEEYIAVVLEIGRAQAELNSIMEVFATRQTELMGGGGINVAGGADAIAASTAAQAAAVERLNQSMADVATKQQIWAIALSAANGDATRAAAIAGQLAAQYDVLTSTMAGASAPMYTAADAMDILARNAASMAREGNAAAGGIANAGVAAGAAASQFQTASNAAGNLSGALRTLRGLQSDLAGLDNLGKARDTIAGLGGGAQGIDVRPMITLAESGAKAGAAIELIRYMSPAAAQGVSGIGQAAGNANAEFQKLQGTVASLLESQLDPGVGVNVDNLLPREDAINENARRLADIAVNGFKGQDWMAEFAAEVPDVYQALIDSGDPKTTAAQMLRDFQDGLLPDLIDKEAAKERVKRMLTGDANMAQLAQEIAAELSTEMGVSLGQAQAAAGAVLGTGAPGAGGAVIDGSAAGAGVVDGLTKAIAAKQAQIQASGGTAGSSWLTGFLAQVQAGIGGSLLAILAAALVGPVATAIAADASRKGAD